MNNKKINSLEVLRVICCVCVISIHIFMSYRVVDSDVQYPVLFVESFTRCCVPVFFMITGFFMFKTDKTLFCQARYLLRKVIIPTSATIFFFLIFNDYLLGNKEFIQSIIDIDIMGILISLYYIFKYGIMPDACFWLWYIIDLI